MDKPAEAIPYLKATIEADPSHGMAYHNLAQSYERLGMYDEALAAYRKACKLPPPGVDIHKWSPRVSLMHMRAIEAGNPIFKPIHGISATTRTDLRNPSSVAPPIPEVRKEREMVKPPSTLNRPLNLPENDTEPRSTTSDGSGV